MQKALRVLLVGLSLAGMLWGFWMHREQLTSVADERPAVLFRDATRTLTGEQEAALARFIDKFFSAYGVALEVRVSLEPLKPEAPRSDRVFLGLCPAARQVIFYAPPLVRRVLGEALVSRLADRHFMAYYAAGNWPEGLADALNLLASRLDEALSK